MDGGAAFHQGRGDRLPWGGRPLWQGWIDQPRLIPRAALPQTRYRLTVGKLDEYAPRRVEAVSSSSDLYGDASLWGEITGAAPRLVGSASAGVTFAPLSWDGRGFEFAGLAALIGGRLVGEDRLGRVDDAHLWAAARHPRRRGLVGGCWSRGWSRMWRWSKSATG